MGNRHPISRSLVVPQAPGAALRPLGSLHCVARGLNGPGRRSRASPDCLVWAVSPIPGFAGTGRGKRGFRESFLSPPPLGEGDREAVEAAATQVSPGRPPSPPSGVLPPEGEKRLCWRGKRGLRWVAFVDTPSHPGLEDQAARGEWGAGIIENGLTPRRARVRAAPLTASRCTGDGTSPWPCRSSPEVTGSEGCNLHRPAAQWWPAGPLALASGREAGEDYMGLLGSIPGKVVLFGFYTVAVFFHLAAGVRHSDVGPGQGLSRRAPPAPAPGQRSSSPSSPRSPSGRWRSYPGAA